MLNALSSSAGTPEAPAPQPSMAQPPQGGPQAAGPAPGQQMAAPSHQQTAAALLHFDAIEQELKGLLADPDMGKADLKSKIIDGATKLVAKGILTPAAAVTQLGSVPEKPFDQKKWVEQNLIQVVSAANAVLQHHGDAFAGQQLDNTSANPNENHISTIAGLAGQYKGMQQNG